MMVAGDRRREAGRAWRHRRASGGQPDPDGAQALVTTSGPQPAVLALRIVIAGLAWWGLIAALGGDLGQLKYFSQVTALTVALTATAGVLGAGLRHAPVGCGRSTGAAAPRPPTPSSPP